ncbi:MAG: hypothetical protein H0W97_07080, partial [Actinobacteria bacterium]|nr:hypothetical protein [Actinomycetota bacterium]
VGGAWLAADVKDESRRRAAWLLVPWALVPAVAALVSLAGRAVPLPRALSFALAIPLLGALGLVAAVVWVRGRFGTVATVVAAVVAVVTLLFSVTFAWETWRTRKPWSDDGTLAEFHTLGRYLTDADRPAIVVVDEPRAEGDFGTVPVMRRIRAELPAQLALVTTVYLGDPELLAEGQPTLRPEVVGFDELSRETWRAARSLLPQDPTVVILRSHLTGFARAVDAHPEWRTNEWMAVVSGPPPPARRPVAPERPSAASLAVWWASSLAVIALAGAGWVIRFGDGSLALRLALAPAAGLVALVVAGLLLERLGVRTGGAGGVVMVIVVSAVGAIVAVTRRSSEPSG